MKTTLAVHTRLAGLPMTIRGGGDPTLLHGFRAAMKNGPAASELRRDAHDCIMVPILTDRPNTRMRAIFAPDGELPSELSSFALQQSSPDQRSVPPCS